MSCELRLFVGSEISLDGCYSKLSWRSDYFSCSCESSSTTWVSSEVSTDTYSMGSAETSLTEITFSGDVSSTIIIGIELSYLLFDSKRLAN